MEMVYVTSHSIVREVSVCLNTCLRTKKCHIIKTPLPQSRDHKLQTYAMPSITIFHIPSELLSSMSTIASIFAFFLFLFLLLYLWKSRRVQQFPQFWPQFAYVMRYKWWKKKIIIMDLFGFTILSLTNYFVDKLWQSRKNTYDTRFTQKVLILCAICHKK